MKYYQFDYLLTSTGWLEHAFAGTDSQGLIQYLDIEKPDVAAAVTRVKGAAIPGFVNAHSHSFQYAMAGSAEVHAPGTTDDFWSWREAMYQCALDMSPDEIEAITTKLYTRLVANGYTSVAEFHYLHHDKDGKPYHNPAETGERIIAAAQAAGIRLTLVPVYYKTGNFGKPAELRQRRFISPTRDAYLQLLEASESIVNKYSNVTIGYGPHSLRAVPAADIIALHDILKDRQWPFHMHVSEQKKEVADCIEYLGARPVAWLLNHLAVDGHVNLVHCTHLNEDEITRLAASKANVILCPSTEGNLGDGIFPLTAFFNAGGHWAIGTDSQIQLNPLEDIRWLDYAQRLTQHRRNTFDSGAATMIENLFKAGNNAAGNRRKQYFAKGQPLDAVVYDISAFDCHLQPENLLPVIVYTAGQQHILGTLVGGEWKYKK